MLTRPTLEKLYNLRLGAMAAAFQEQQQNAQIAALSFEERFALRSMQNTRHATIAAQ